jgi:Mrp family chromosome partitioning ATPase
MTRSLNQAFLRAFSKDGSTAATSDKMVAESRKELSPVVRREEVSEASGAHVRLDAGSGQNEVYGPPRTADLPRAAEVPAPHFTPSDDSDDTSASGESAVDREAHETWILGDVAPQPFMLDTEPLWVIPVSEPLVEWPVHAELPAPEWIGPDPDYAPDRDDSADESVREDEIHESARWEDAETTRAEETSCGMAGMEQPSEASAEADVLARAEACDELPLEVESALSEEELQALAPPSPADDEEELTDGSDHQEAECSEEEEEGFAGAWEVDHLGWTTVCLQLYEGESVSFRQAGQQLFSASAEGLRVLAVTSAYRGEGRTTLSLLLARAAASAGVRVAVMDADLDNPQLAWNARVQPASDWRRVLLDRSPLEEAAIYAVDERMTLFPLETQSRGEPLRLSDPRVTKLVHDIASRFDLLIIDMGPIAHGDRRLFAAGKVCPVDAAVVVRDVRSTTEEQTQTIVQRLVDMGVEAVGIAENFARDLEESVSY